MFELLYEGLNSSSYKLDPVKDVITQTKANIEFIKTSKKQFPSVRKDDIKSLKKTLNIETNSYILILEISGCKLTRKESVL